MMKLYKVIVWITLIVYLLLLYFHIKASLFFYTTTTIVFILLNTIYLKQYKTGKFFCFELFFSISFFASCFIFPFIIKILDNYRARIFVTNDEVQCKFYIVAMLGYLFYLVGLLSTKTKVATNTFSNIVINKSFNTIANICCSFYIILFLISDGVLILQRYTGTSKFSEYGQYLFYITIFCTISTISNFLRVPNDCKTSFKKTLYSLGFLYVVNMIIVLFFFFFSGYRSQALQIILPIIYMYIVYIKNIKPFHLLLILIAGIFLMSIIGLVRSGSSFSMGKYNITDYSQDFIPVNAAGIWLIDYTDTHGSAHGSNALLQIFSIVPFAQSFLLLFIDKNSLALSSSRLFTSAYIEDFSNGLGTNIIGDLYYTFGLIGVLVLMFLLGAFIKRISTAKNKYILLMFLIMFGNSVFAARVEFLYIVRLISFGVIILFLLDLFTIKKPYTT